MVQVQRATQLWLVDGQAVAGGQPGCGWWTARLWPVGARLCRVDNQAVAGGQPGSDRWTARLWLVDSQAVPRFTGLAELSGLAALPGLTGLAGLAGSPTIRESNSIHLHAQHRQENFLNIPC